MSSHVVGHDEQRRRIARAWSAGRLAHAYLFVGPEGVGKRTFAVHFAKTLLCQRPNIDALEPCNECASCKVFDGGNHPDFSVFEQDPDKTVFEVEMAREVVEPLMLKPALGGRHVAVIDSAEKFSGSAGNALLKIIEEPPEQVVLLLITTTLEGILPTIRSRCQTMTFSRLEVDELRQVLLKSGLAATQDEARSLAEAAGGSVANVDDLRDADWRELQPRLLERLSRPPVDAVRFARDIVKYCEDAGKEAGPKRRRAAMVVRTVLEMYRKALQHRSGAAASPNEVVASAVECAEDTLIDLIARSLEADEQIRRYLHLPTVIDCWIDDLAQIAAGAYAPIG